MKVKLRAWWQHMRAQVFTATASRKQPPGSQRREHMDLEAALQAYFTTLSALLIQGSLREAGPQDEVRQIAQARTLAVLQQLDPTRKARVVKHLYEEQLIGMILHGPEAVPGGSRYTVQAIVSLQGVDLSRADLRNVSLYGADLHAVNLRQANLHKANLARANLTGADLREANLVESVLQNAQLTRALLTSADLSQAIIGGSGPYGRADLGEADLQGAKLWRANMENVNLAGANLQRAQITPEQLAQAGSLQGAIMPDGPRHP
jgi:hypothetical protein